MTTDSPAVFSGTFVADSKYPVAILAELVVPERPVVICLCQLDETSRLRKKGKDIKKELQYEQDRKISCSVSIQGSFPSAGSSPLNLLRIVERRCRKGTQASALITIPTSRTLTRSKGAPGNVRQLLFVPQVSDSIFHFPTHISTRLVPHLALRNVENRDAPRRSCACIFLSIGVDIGE